MTDFDSKSVENTKKSKKTLKTKKSQIMQKNQYNIFILSSLYQETHF